MKIRHLIETIDVDSEIDDGLFSQLWFAGEPDGLSRLIETKLIDFFVPDSIQMLYLVLAPQIPSLYAVRLKGKPYDYGVKTKNGRYYLDFDVIYSILAESSIEHQPLTILASDEVIPPLIKHFNEGRYDLPAGSCMVTCTKTLEPSSKECERIFGIPPIISFYRPPGAVSYCCRVDERGFRAPPWMRVESRDNSLQFYDLGSLLRRAIVDTGQVGFVEGQYVR